MSLKQTIVLEATKLFRTQGFAATSMRQIAKAADCTNAALYHYYPDGKKHILQAVIRQSSKNATDSLQFTETESLEEFLAQLSALLSERMAQTSSNLSWIMMQFDSLPDDEKSLIQDQILGFNQVANQQVSQHVSDPNEARMIAWLINCAFYGYRQFFSNLALGERVDLSPEEFGAFLTSVISKSRED